MKSYTTDDFWAAYSTLPDSVKRLARDAYKRLALDPRHPSLHFKRIHTTRPVYSVRIGLSYRAVGILTAKNEIYWFWIGSHADYDKLT